MELTLKEWLFVGVLVALAAAFSFYARARYRLEQARWKRYYAELDLEKAKDELRVARLRRAALICQRQSDEATTPRPEK